MSATARRTGQAMAGDSRIGGAYWRLHARLSGARAPRHCTLPDTLLAGDDFVMEC